MRKLPRDYPLIHRHFRELKFAVKTSIVYFKAVAADMKSEQTIQRSQKGSDGVIIYYLPLIFIYFFNHN